MTGQRRANWRDELNAAIAKERSGLHSEIQAQIAPVREQLDRLFEILNIARWVVILGTIAGLIVRGIYQAVTR